MSGQALLLVLAIMCFVISGIVGWADPNYPWRGRLWSWGMAFFAGAFLWPALANLK